MEADCDWQLLPCLVIQSFLKQLPLKSRLLASGTCKTWRECLFSPALWRRQTFVLDSERPLKRMHFLREKQCDVYAMDICIIVPELYHLSRVKRERLCSETHHELGKYLERLTVCHHIESFMLKIEKTRQPHPCTYSNKDHHEDIYLIQESITEILKNSTKLKKFSLGCSPEEYRPMYILENIRPCVRSLLSSLHISTISIGGDLECLSLDFISTGASVNMLCNLQYLSMDWKAVTPAFLNAFNDRNSHGSCTPLKKMNLFVADHECSKHAANHPDATTWRSFSTLNKGVKLSLIFLSQVGGVCSELQHVTPVFMLKFLECDSICEVAYGKLIQWHRDTLEAHVMASACNSNRLTELDNGHDLWMHMRTCSLKFITVIGYFIYDEIVKLVAAEFAPNLEVFHVPLNQILTSAEASYFMIPISGSKVNELFSAMEAIMQRQWRPLRRHPLRCNYFSEGLDDDFYLTAAASDMLF